MSVVTLIVAILALACVGYWLGRSRALALEQRDTSGDAMLRALNSLPQYYGYYVALWCGLPALALLLIWLLAQGPVVDRLLLASLPAEMTAGASPAQIDLLVATIKNAAVGPRVRRSPTRRSRRPRTATARCVRGAQRRWSWSCSRSPSPGWSGRGSGWRRAFARATAVERIIAFLLVLCSVVAILTTLGIVLSLLIESVRFFERVPPHEFLFGLNWEPQIAIRADQVAGAGAFGAVPVFWGTHHGQRGRDDRRPADRHPRRRSIMAEYASRAPARRGQAAARDPRRHPDHRLRLLRRAGGLAGAARPRRLDRRRRLADRGDRAGRGHGHHADPVHLVVRPTTR